MTGLWHLTVVVELAVLIVLVGALVRDGRRDLDGGWFDDPAEEPRPKLAAVPPLDENELDRWRASR